MLNRCRILASTIYQTYVGNQAARSFDVVVVDEVSMLMLPLVYYAAGLARQAVVVAGDFRQLGAIVKSNAPAAHAWLKRDVFEKLGVPEHLRQGGPMPALVALRTQYQMCAPICDIVSSFFYPEQSLHSETPTISDARKFPLGNGPLLYVDTSPFHPWTEHPGGGRSRCNFFHALLARNIVLHLAGAGFVPAADSTNEALGVVTPFRAQSKLLQALIEDRLGGQGAGMAATVHRFQGNAKDAIILDLTDSYGTPLSSFLRARQLTDEGARLLNVAMSRARNNLVVIANFQFIREQAQHTSIVPRLLDYLEQNGEKLDIDELLPLVDRDWVNPHRHRTPPGFEMPEGIARSFNEGTFYRAFEHDLERTIESIDLVSPYATIPGTSRWVDLLRGAMLRGVDVRIVMCPPNEAAIAPHVAARLIERLQAIGVTIELRSGMHEKKAILDRRILWIGSLNILSHRATQEIMLRIESVAACEEFGRL